MTFYRVNDYTDFCFYCHLFAKCVEQYPRIKVDGFKKHLGSIIQTYQSVIPATDLSNWNCVILRVDPSNSDWIKNVKEVAIAQQEKLFLESGLYSDYCKRLFKSIDDCDVRTAIIRTFQLLEPEIKNRCGLQRGIIEFLINNDSLDVQAALRSYKCDPKSILSRAFANASHFYRYDAVPRDYKKIVDYNGYAAELGDIDCKILDGFFWLGGKYGLPQNKERAHEIFRKASIEKWNEDRAADEPDINRRIFKYVDSLRCVSKQAIAITGYFYESGLGVSRNIDQALDLFKTVEDNIDVMRWIGDYHYFYLNGNKEEAFKWIKKAALKGDDIACYKLGNFYKNGIGTSISNDKAKYWYEQSARGGNPECMYKYAKALADDNRHEAALEWYIKSANMNNMDAITELVDIYKKQQNDDEAIKWAHTAVRIDGDLSSQRYIWSQESKSKVEAALRSCINGEPTADSYAWFYEAIALRSKVQFRFNEILEKVPANQRKEAAHVLIGVILKSSTDFDSVKDMLKFISIMACPLNNKEGELYSHLIKWYQEKPSTSREAAVQTIIDCFKNKKECLVLENLELTSLPTVLWDFTFLRDLNLSGNNLDSLPDKIGNLGNLQRLNVDNNQISSLPDSMSELINLIFLSAQNNQIRFLPDVILQMWSGLYSPSSTFQGCPFIESPYYEFDLKLSDIKNDPVKVLKKLAMVLQLPCQHKGRLCVTFTDQKGEDGGALGRQLIHDLFHELVKTRYFIQYDDFYQPVVRDANRDFVVYEDIGKVLMYCFVIRAYPIGSLFQEELFDSIRHFYDDDVPDDENIASAQPEYKKLWEDSKRGVYEKNARDLFPVFDIEVPPHTVDLSTIAGLGEKFRKGLIEIIKPKLMPLDEIAKGMRFSKFYRGQILPTEFSKIIQGELSKELILSKLVFSDKINRRKQKWLKDWIMRASSDELRSFVKKMTGASTLGENCKELRVVKTGGTMYFHGCAGQLDFPFDDYKTKTGRNLFMTKFSNAIATLDDFDSR